ncbi:hypothetical protein EV401DRAFT_1905784 [Pisolithus croceorrhizus]|nr:hypothetical protein EV401DRAFT_1905784 [Pisolithus croceorrhizus]
MAQAITMGPPSSPRETRRSGRRSAPSASASTSKSPDSPASESTPRNKDSSRPALSSGTSNGRSKRPEQEDHDDGVPHKNGHVNGSASNHGNANGRAKRKGKEKEKAQQTSDLPIESISRKLGSSSATGTAEPHEEDVEEQGITRCICGLNEDDADGGEFMVQCETCNVWQHGLCMGFKSEVELQDDYHCEQCKPERHQELFKRLAKKARQSSTHSHLTTSRLSRSHSPTHLSKPPKRRNTMNSRDAAFDESLKEIMEATAAEAAAVTELPSSSVNAADNGQTETHDDESSGRRKRKRAEDDPPVKKRTRSASSASDPPEIASVVLEDPPPLPPPPPSKRSQIAGGKSGSRNRRGGASSRKVITANVDGAVAEGDEVLSKRSGQNSRSRAAPTPRRPPPSSHVSGSVLPDHPSTHKRYHQSGGNNTAENSRAYYRNSHAYAVSQQPLFTSWNLPDYLAHLEHMLPSETPRPLEVRSVLGPGGRESMDRTMERGVRVKWPSKRMSVGDMNKRVRALVEWVGREQAGALDRGRRKEALEKALKEMRVSDEVANLSAPMDTVDGNTRGADNSPSETPSVPSQQASVESTHHTCGDSKATMKMMEELMEELINFQERFGPGVKSRERERRPAS